MYIALYCPDTMIESLRWRLSGRQSKRPYSPQGSSSSTARRAQECHARHGTLPRSPPLSRSYHWHRQHRPDLTAHSVVASNPSTCLHSLPPPPRPPPPLPQPTMVQRLPFHQQLRRISSPTSVDDGRRWTRHVLSGASGEYAHSHGSRVFRR